jgi:hypothetical protein
MAISRWRENEGSLYGAADAGLNHPYPAQKGAAVHHERLQAFRLMHLFHEELAFDAV